MPENRPEIQVSRHQTKIQTYHPGDMDHHMLVMGQLPNYRYVVTGSE
jgi:hypothetical protein